jgi:hypothetical protein
MNVLQEIEDILKRPVEFEQVTFKGQRGYLPIYFNHHFRNNVSAVFATDEETAADNFLNYLKSVSKGDTNEQSRDTSKREVDSED